MTFLSHRILIHRSFTYVNSCMSLIFFTYLQFLRFKIFHWSATFWLNRDFIARPKCSLISPAKPELGRVVKIKLEEINREIRYTTGVNQWQSTQKAMDWFKNIKNPETYAFLKFDIVSFYPSITPKLLENAIKFGRLVPGIFISKADEEMILHCRKTFLFCEEEPL